MNFSIFFPPKTPSPGISGYAVECPAPILSAVECFTITYLDYKGLLYLVFFFSSASSSMLVFYLLPKSL